MVGDVSGVLRLATHALSCCRFWCRLGWPDLLDHPFVRETDTERLVREKALADAMELADSSRGWKVRRAAAHEAVNQGLAWDTVLMCAGLDCTVTMLDDRSGAATLGVACCWSHEAHQISKACIKHVRIACRLQRHAQQSNSKAMLGCSMAAIPASGKQAQCMAVKAADTC